MTEEATAGSDAVACPAWCVSRHGQRLGEDDWVHVSASVATAGGVPLRRQMSIDPYTGAVDGPYVVIGEAELTTDEARAVGEALLRLTRTA